MTDFSRTLVGYIQDIYAGNMHYPRLRSACSKNNFLGDLKNSFGPKISSDNERKKFIGPREFLSDIFEGRTKFREH